MVKRILFFYRCILYIEDCVIVRCTVADHPDPCSSYRCENYDANSCYAHHMNRSNTIYINGQYDHRNYIPGFGHGRVEVTGKVMANLAREHYEAHCRQEQKQPAHPAGVADRMMLSIPGRERKRRGIVHRIEDYITTGYTLCEFY